MTNYQLDPSHSTVGFSVKHMMIAKVHGVFEKLTGSLSYDKADPQSAVAEATIEASSINTREAQRDTHLKSPDFFDIEKFPTLTFKSKGVTPLGSGGLKVVGDLTIKGVSKEVVLDIDGPSEELKDPFGNVKIGLSATTKVKRKDFGLTWNSALETGGVLVGDEVTIALDLQFVKKV